MSLPGTDLLPVGSDVESTVENKLPSTVGASVLSSPNGKIGVSGGTFTAVGGNLITVQVNLSGLKEGGQADTTVPGPAPKEITGAQIQDNGDAARQESLTSRLTSDSSTVQTSEPRVLVPPSINDVYFQCLASKKRGSPLWIPGTNKQLPIEYQRKGLMIGDVGVITDRGFYDSLFNITLPPGHPLAINADELPANFTPLEVRPRDIQRYSEFKQGSYLSSASIRNSCDNDNPSGIIFESSASEGAVLTLPSGSNSEDLGNKRRLREYLSVHGEEMYRCALTGHGRIITNGDLRIITGYDKATKWGMAAFSNSTTQTDSFRLTFRPNDESSIGWIHSWESSGTAEVKVGPDMCEIVALRMDDPLQQDAEYENQCVFVRTANITLQKDIWVKLLSELDEIDTDDGPDNPYYRSSSSTQGSPPTGSSSSSSGTTFNVGSQSASGGSQLAHLSGSANTLDVHPSNSINEKLLMLNPKVRMAITGDQDWISVLKEEDSILPPPEQLWTRIMESFIIREADGVVFLEKIATRSTTPIAAHVNVPSIPEIFGIDSTHPRSTWIAFSKPESLEPSDLPKPSIFDAPSITEKTDATYGLQIWPFDCDKSDSTSPTPESTKLFDPLLKLEPLIPGQDAPVDTSSSYLGFPYDQESTSVLLSSMTSDAYPSTPLEHEVFVGLDPYSYTCVYRFVQAVGALLFDLERDHPLTVQYLPNAHANQIQMQPMPMKYGYPDDRHSKSYGHPLSRGRDGKWETRDRNDRAYRARPVSPRNRKPRYADAIQVSRSQGRVHASVGVDSRWDKPHRCHYYPKQPSRRFQHKDHYRPYPSSHPTRTRKLERLSWDREICDELGLYVYHQQLARDVTITPLAPYVPGQTIGQATRVGPNISRPIQSANSTETVNVTPEGTRRASPTSQIKGLSIVVAHKTPTEPSEDFEMRSPTGGGLVMVDSDEAFPGPRDDSEMDLTPDGRRDSETSSSTVERCESEMSLSTGERSDSQTNSSSVDGQVLNKSLPMEDRNGSGTRLRTPDRSANEDWELDYDQSDEWSPTQIFTTAVVAPARDEDEVSLGEEEPTANYTMDTYTRDRDREELRFSEELLANHWIPKLETEWDV